MKIDIEAVVAHAENQADIELNENADMLLNRFEEYRDIDAAIVDRIKADGDSKEDVVKYIRNVVNNLSIVANCWACCCFCCQRTFTLSVLVLLHELKLNERFSLVVGFWFLVVSLLILFIGGADKLIPVLLVSTIISIVLQCNLDDCMESIGNLSNPAVQCLVGACQIVEQLTYCVILVATLPFSCIEGFILRCRRFGGDYPILKEREEVINVTLRGLIDDINSSSDGYCFIRVLSEPDRALFLSKVPDYDYVDIYQRKAIKLSIWLNILGSVRLSSNYVIYRRAYYGENKGRMVTSDRLTNYVVPLWHFDRYEAKSKTFSIEALTRRFEKLMVRGDPVIRIVLRDNHMEIFEFSSNYKLSSWENRDYEFPNERYGESLK